MFKGCILEGLRSSFKNVRQSRISYVQCSNDKKTKKSRTNKRLANQTGKIESDTSSVSTRYC